MKVLFFGLLLIACVGVYVWADKLADEFKDKASD